MKKLLLIVVLLALGGCSSSNPMKLGGYCPYGQYCTFAPEQPSSITVGK